MASQSNEIKQPDVEVIDLTDETLTTTQLVTFAGNKQDITITLEDSFAPIEIASSDGGNEQLMLEYPPEPSPTLPVDMFGEWKDSSEDDSDTGSSSLPSRLPSSASLLPASQATTSPIKSTPSPRKFSSQVLGRSTSSSSSSPSPLSKNKTITKSTTHKLNKQSREEAKKAKLKQKEVEKMLRMANSANAASKALDNCTTNICRNIIDAIGDPEEISLRTLFDESMVKYKLVDCPKVENSINWTYKRTEVLDGNCVAKYKESTWTIIIMKGNDYLTKLLAYKANDCTKSIKSFLSDLRRRCGTDIILMVYNLANHLKVERMKEAKNYRKTFKDRFEDKTTNDDQTNGIQTDDAPSAVSIGVTELQELRLMLEMEFKHQHPDWKLHLEFYEKTNEIVQALVRYSLSLAKLEVKQKAKSSTGLDWAINMDKERATDPTKSMEDLTKLWMTQLQQFPQITLPIAKAIAAEYPSPCALLDQYKSLTTSEAEKLLAELYVQRNLKRQIGINISKRIHSFMTCEDADVHIGLS